MMQRRGMMLRYGVQFHWRNAGYEDFDAFLASLAREKRKKIRQDRRRVCAEGISFRRLVGNEIGAEHWRFFGRCYDRTYALHRSSPYLNLNFFEHMGRTMAENLLLILAERAGKPVASASAPWLSRLSTARLCSLAPASGPSSPLATVAAAGSASPGCNAGGDEPTAQAVKPPSAEVMRKERSTDRPAGNCSRCLAYIGQNA